MSGNVVARVVNRDEWVDVREGERYTFGRSETAVDITVWTAINGIELSRTAGELWCHEGEMWVRNLSASHELQLLVPGLPPLDPLPAREHGTRGWARSLPAPTAWVCGPGGCRLQVLQRGQGQASLPLPGPRGTAADATRYAEPVPEALLPFAVALCEPLLLEEAAPATYNEVARRLGVSRATARRRTEDLLGLYARDLPQWQARVERRRQAAEPRLVAGRWLFPADDDDAPRTPSGVVELPSYDEVARLLVRRRLVTAAHLDLLPAEEPAPPAP